MSAVWVRPLYAGQPMLCHLSFQLYKVHWWEYMWEKDLPFGWVPIDVSFCMCSRWSLRILLSRFHFHLWKVYDLLKHHCFLGSPWSCFSYVSDILGVLTLYKLSNNPVCIVWSIRGTLCDKLLLHYLLLLSHSVKWHCIHQVETAALLHHSADPLAIFNNQL